MDKLLYVAMTSAAETMNAQAIHAGNLANLSTPGFKAELDAQRAMPVYGDGLPSRVYVGAAVSGYDLAAGSLEHTGNALDIAVAKDGWLAVQGVDGTEGYSKRGDLRVENGALVNGAGNVILGDGGAINVQAAQNISIGSDGTVEIVPLDNSSAKIIAGRIKLVKPSNGHELHKRLDGLFVSKTGSALEADPNLTLETGVIEASNVSPVGEMIEMISLARNLELSIKVMKHAEENDQASARILQV